MAEFNPKEFAEAWAERLKAAPEYDPKILSLPGRYGPLESSNFGQQFKNVWEQTRGGIGNEGVGELWKRYSQDYFPRVQEVAEKAGYPTIGQELDEFVSKTGLNDPRSGGRVFNFSDAKHEIHSHLRPYNQGFAPDYRVLPLDIPGMPETFAANPVSPFNEKLATDLDRMVAETGKGSTQQFTPKSVKALLTEPTFSSSLESHLARGGKQLNPDVVDGVPTFSTNKTGLESRARDFVRRYYPSRMYQFNDLGDSLDSVSSEISEQLNKKLLPQIRRGWKQVGQLFYPMGDAASGFPDRVDSFQSLFSGRDLEGSSNAQQLSNPGVGYMSVLPGGIPNPRMAMQALRQTWPGWAKGAALAPVTNPDIAFQVGKGNYEEALKQTGVDTAKGFVVGGTLQSLAPGLMSNPVTGTLGAALAVKGAIDSKVAYDAAKQGYSSPEAYLQANRKADSAAFTSALGDATSRYRAPSPSAPITRLPPGSVPRGYGIAIKDGKEVAVPWGSVAGIKKVGPALVGKPWWDFSRFGDSNK